jgi:hypothetical protein
MRRPLNYQHYATYDLGPTYLLGHVLFRLAGPYGRREPFLHQLARRFPRTPRICQIIRFPPIPRRDGFLHDTGSGAIVLCTFEQFTSDPIGPIVALLLR